MVLGSCSGCFCGFCTYFLKLNNTKLLHLFLIFLKKIIVTIIIIIIIIIIIKICSLKNYAVNHNTQKSSSQSD